MAETREEWTVCYTRSNGEKHYFGPDTREGAEATIKINTWNGALGKYHNVVWLNGEPMYRLMRREVVVTEWEEIPFEVADLPVDW